LFFFLEKYLVINHIYAYMYILPE